MDPPIVIGSAPSSGSTLLRVLLGKLPGVVSGGELNVLDRPELFEPRPQRFAELIATYVREGFPRNFVTGNADVFTHVDTWGWSREGIVELGADCASWAELLERFFTQCVEEAGARRWIEKTPGNVYAFHRAVATFPNAHFVHIVRDGRDAIASLMRRGASPFLATSRWLCGILAGRRLAGWRHYHELRYEDLVSDPTGTLARLCDELGLAFDPKTLGQVTPEARPAIASWTASEHAPVTTDAIGAHRDLDAELLAAYMASVRLSAEGVAMLPILPVGDGATPMAGMPRRDGAAANLGESFTLSALELQTALGYDPPDAPVRQLSGAERAEVEAEIERFQRGQLGRYGPGRYPHPTTIRPPFPPPLEIAMPAEAAGAELRSVASWNAVRTGSLDLLREDTEPVRMGEFLDEAHHRYYGRPWLLGRFYFEHLCRRGVRPEDRVLDLGCGAGRLGIWLIPYLEAGGYFGLDAHLRSLLAFARYEAVLHDLAPRRPSLLLTSEFEVARFGTTFTVVLDLFVTKHLPADRAQFALGNARAAMPAGGRLFMPHTPSLGTDAMAELGFTLTHTEEVLYPLFAESDHPIIDRDHWHEFTVAEPRDTDP